LIASGPPSVTYDSSSGYTDYGEPSNGMLRIEAGPVWAASQIDGGQLGAYRGDGTGAIGPLGDAGPTGAVHEGTNSAAPTTTFGLLGQVGSQLLHALSTGPQVMELPGGVVGIHVADGGGTWTPHPSQVGYGSRGDVITIPGAGEAPAQGLPDQVAALLAYGGAGVPEQPGVAQAAPPSRGEQRAAGGPGSPQPQGATPASVNDGDSPEQIARRGAQPSQGFSPEAFVADAKRNINGAVEFVKGELGILPGTIVNLPGEIGDSFTSGKSWDSVQGLAQNSMLFRALNPLVGLTPKTPLYGNTDAYNIGKDQVAPWADWAAQQAVLGAGFGGAASLGCRLIARGGAAKFWGYAIQGGLRSLGGVQAINGAGQALEALRNNDSVGFLKGVGNIGMGLLAALLGPSCFTGETLVSTVRGDLRIDQLLPGDLVSTGHVAVPISSLMPSLVDAIFQEDAPGTSRQAHGQLALTTAKALDSRDSSFPPVGPWMDQDGDRPWAGMPLAMGLDEFDPEPSEEILLEYTHDELFGEAEVRYIFPADRLARLVSGEILPMRDLQPGMDVVLDGGGVCTIHAASPYCSTQPRRGFQNGHTARRVIGTVKHIAYYVIDVTWGGQTVTASPNHLFWSQTRQDWIPARMLRVGERLRMSDGTTCPVERISRLRDGLVNLYNIEVEELHAYFVGGGTRAVLVHNGLPAGPGGPGDCIGKPQEPNTSTPNVRQKLLSQFNKSQRKRLEDKLQDIAHVRNGHPAPSGQWHERDGIPFDNREGLLPPSSKGYSEYRVLGADGKPSGARIVIDEADGRVFYSQHYSDDATGFSEITNLWQQFFGEWK
jgi:hypothetical protein